MALLCLCLLSCVQSFKDQLVSSFQPTVFTNAKGPLFNIPIGLYPGITYPAPQWVIYEWLNVVGTQFLNQNLICIINPQRSAYWNGGPPKSTWMFIGIGAKD